MRPLRRIPPALLLAGLLALPLAVTAHPPAPAQVTGPGSGAAFGLNAEAPAPPTFGLAGGRFTSPQQVALTAAEGEQIFFTLDGSEPTPASTPYTAPITLAESANVAAIAVRDGIPSAPTVEGYLIKTAEEPLARFAVMGDIHTSDYAEPDVAKWQQHFDTLSALMPNPDAIISNGDQINDNNFNTGDDHAVVRRILEENLARTGMRDTKMLLSFGNHDDRLAKMSAMYPKDWFPHEGGGYYLQDVGGYPFLILNTENYSATQRTWVRDTLTRLNEDPQHAGKPIFVAGHRPTSGTVNQGSQASNSGITEDLAAFPQVVYFSGHSHYNINDERSIHQKNFTAVNEGSMTYGETFGQYWANGEGLVWTAHNASSQSVIVEVYPDRTEIDRINYAAENDRAYTPAGVWSFQQDAPFDSAGTLAGPTWTIPTGNTPEEIRAGFAYTGNTDHEAPVRSATAPTQRQTSTGPALRIPQATDNTFVIGYRVEITDVETGQVWQHLDPKAQVSGDFYMMPRPAHIDIPLAVRQGPHPAKPIQHRVAEGREYRATVTAVDSADNAAEPHTITFIAGELTRDDALPAEIAALQERIERIAGTGAAATPEDLAFVVS
ncbi:chitobiase/beta-hexosaminidase C-terminal domain-containing protein, partial [Leucobacter sp. M11]|uniref:chitobiase/beta-hexosaminidase C-terminal domain-containing protein n=1 Tax=Leucobacter sp. M11 TaxID=2993565 RepID=UPI002D803734